jgi:hypothetical protein
MSASAPSASIVFGPMTVFELAAGVSPEAIEGSRAAERISAANGWKSAFMGKPRCH